LKLYCCSSLLVRRRTTKEHRFHRPAGDSTSTRALKLYYCCSRYTTANKEVAPCSMQDAHLQSLVSFFSVYDSYNTLQYNSKKTTYNGTTLLPTFSTKLLGMPLMVAGRSNRLFTIKSLKKKQNSNNKNGGIKQNNKTTQARSGHLDDYDDGAEYKVTFAIIYTAVARSQISTPALLPPTAGDARVYERQRL